MKKRGTGDTAALAAALRKRRDQLRLSQQGLADAAGVSKYTVQAIEREDGRTLQPETKAKLEDGLQLARGSIDDVLHGRGPVREPGAAPVETVEQPFDIATASYEQLGKHSEWLSTTSDDPTLGPRWMASVLQKRFEVENSHNKHEESDRHAM